MRKKKMKKELLFLFAIIFIYSTFALAIPSTTLKDRFVDNQDGTASITGWFQSAWSPPLQAFATFCEQNPGVNAEIFYQEEGMCFVGRWNNTEGDDFYEYGDATSENIREHVPDYLVDEFDLEYNLAQWEELNEEMD